MIILCGRCGADIGERDCACARAAGQREDVEAVRSHMERVVALAAALAGPGGPEERHIEQARNALNGEPS